MMEFVELSWTDQGGGRYSLAVEYPADLEAFRREEIERVIHDAGFFSEGDGRWMTPDDQNAPAALWEQLTTSDTTFGVDMAVLPPSLMLALADLHFA
jgi:hypothetical protein